MEVMFFRRKTSGIKVTSELHCRGMQYPFNADVPLILTQNKFPMFQFRPRQGYSLLVCLTHLIAQYSNP